MLDFFLFLLLFFFLAELHIAVFGILVSQLGIKLMPPAVEAQSLNHRTTREVLIMLDLKRFSHEAETAFLHILPDGTLLALIAV